MPPERPSDVKPRTDAPKSSADGTRSTERSADEGQQLHPGTLLESRFHNVRMLGRGGMGEVHEAVDLGLGTRVAVKTVRVEQDSSEMRLQRLRREIPRRTCQLLRCQ